jgi:hypothetical protein
MSDKLNKSKVFEWVAKSHKETGQGLSAVVRCSRMGRTVSYLLDALEEEGAIVKLKMMNSSLGHPESQYTYFVTGQYNIIDDAVGRGEDAMSYLNYVRMYLGCLDEDESRKDTAKWVNPTTRMLIQNEEFMNGYAEWLNRNAIALRDMKDMSTLYTGKDFIFSEEESEWIKEWKFYKNNQTVKTAIEKVKDLQSNNIQKDGLIKELISLHRKRGNDEDLKEIEKYEKEQEADNLEQKNCEKLLFWLESLDKDCKVKDEFDKKDKDEKVS